MPLEAHYCAQKTPGRALTPTAPGGSNRPWEVSVSDRPRTVWELLLDHYQPATRWPTPGALAPLLDPRTKTTPALELIDKALVEALATPDSRLIISMPPQEGKSVRASRDLPVWALTRNPDLRIVSGSYAQGLANRNGRAARNAIAAHPELGIEVAPDHGSASEWSLKGHHGGLVSVGRGAGISGRPADLLIIDDPLKDRAEADSQTIRDTCWDWWTDALAARLSPGAPVIVISTRWHEDDLPGRLAATGGWKLLNIPAQCEDPETDPLGRKLGQYMVSARGRTRAQWEKRKAEAGPRAWAALYQGHPSPAEGGVLQRAWWRRWSLPPTPQRIIQSWDLAFTGSKGSDYVVGQVWGQAGPDAYLLAQARGRWSYSETLDQIRILRAAWPQTSAILIEAAANGHAAIDTLRREIPGILPVAPRGGKTARADAVAPLIAAGNVHLPQTAWADELIEEAAGFPNATHDDQVDALTQALTYLYLPQSQGGLAVAF